MLLRCHPSSSTSPYWSYVTDLVLCHCIGPLPVPHTPRITLSPLLQVTAGPAAGFLLQALAAASDTLDSFCPSVTSRGHRDPLPGSWVSAMLAQPLVAFGFHRLSGDRATGNLLLGTATALAPVVATWHPEATRLLAARAVTVVTTGSLLVLAGLTGNGAGALGALLMAAGYWAPSEEHPWVLLAGSLALEQGLWALRRSVEGTPVAEEQ